MIKKEINSVIDQLEEFIDAVQAVEKSTAKSKKELAK